MARPHRLYWDPSRGVYMRRVELGQLAGDLVIVSCTMLSSRWEGYASYVIGSGRSRRSIAVLSIHNCRGGGQAETRPGRSRVSGLIRFGTFTIFRPQQPLYYSCGMAAADIPRAEKARADVRRPFSVKGFLAEIRAMRRSRRADGSKQLVRPPASFAPSRNSSPGHYTTAIVANPVDAVPYTNRAAAFLKLDKCVGQAVGREGELRAGTTMRSGIARWRSSGRRGT